MTPPSHRSRQVLPPDLDAGDADRRPRTRARRWVRREHPTGGAAHRDAQATRARPAADDRPLAARVADLDLAAVELRPWEEVVDPGGGEVEAFIACAQEVVPLVDELAARLRLAARCRSPRSGPPIGRRGGSRWPTPSSRSWRRCRTCCSPPPGCVPASGCSTSAAAPARRRGSAAELVAPDGVRRRRRRLRRDDRGGGGPPGRRTCRRGRVDRRPTSRPGVPAASPSTSCCRASA